jgi:hypothetical protein
MSFIANELLMIEQFDLPRAPAYDWLFSMLS